MCNSYFHVVARMTGAIISRLWQKRVSAYAWAVLIALLILPFSLRPTSAATPPHIAVISMENHGYTTIVGNSSMPFTQSLINGNGIASITDTCHPSLPNYLSITDGSIHGCPQDTAPSDATYSGPTLYDELSSAGISWKAYVDGAVGNCDVNSGFGNFDVNHVPQAYYNSIRNNAAECNQIVPSGQLTTDLTAGTAPSLIWITPNLINDMHDGTDQQGDAYLNSQVTQLRNSSWFTPGSRILVWWDEDEGTSNEQILLISVGSSHSVTIGPASHYGVLRGLEEAYGVGLLGHSADASVPAEGGTVGDILPLLTGAAPPPPPPPSPS
ncbi:MAG TPA: alkaline phosphatase family protein, partial [Candidatus Dormibacteraeota bacterium]|nr:alkaline phosphatase family protein [Candidatus Dormibacteraeota bacterium]